MDDAIDQSFGNKPLVRLDASDFYHRMIVPQGYNLRTGYHFMNPTTEEKIQIQKSNFRNVQIDGIGVSISNVAGPYLPVFLTRLGASNFQVGLLSSMPGVTGLLIAIFVGRFL